MIIRNSWKHQQGYLTLITIVLIVIIGFTSATLAYIIFGSAFGALNFQQATKALYIAESGLEDAAHTLQANVISQRGECTGLSLSNNSLGGGAYSISATGPFYVSSATTLNGALTANATTLTVASTVNYQSAGRIMIDKELMNYTAKDATHFLFVQRGIDSTAAVSHASGARVGQYQCQLLSTGGLPSLTLASGAPGGKRILNEAVQLQEAWMVGNASGGNLTMARWNRPTENIWSNAPSTGNFNLNGLSIISYVDGWAVGASNNFLRWNGSTWTSTSTGLPNVTFRGVYCVASNNCHAVGNLNNNNIPMIADWNGTNWTATTLNVGSRAGHQYSVHCPTATSCWSVGDIGQNNNRSYFYRWNGSTWTNVLLTGVLSNDFPFEAVFCPSTSDCWAVGNSGTFARWNGSAWTFIATGLPAVPHNGIFCNSSSDCWVVGNTSSGVDTILHWNGSAWSANPSNPTPATNLNSVACRNSNDCWAVGAASGGEPSFIHWDGSGWSTVTTTGLPNVQANAISIIGPNDQPWSAWSESF